MQQQVMEAGEMEPQAFKFSLCLAIPLLVTSSLPPKTLTESVSYSTQ